MSRKRGNRNWCKPELIRMPCVSTTSFEEVVGALRLSPSEYAGCPALKEWVWRNKDRKYVPTDLLQAWGFAVTGDL